MQLGRNGLAISAVPDSFRRYDEAIGNLADWLLEGPVQVTTGADRGGVVGWLEGDRTSAFVYPEICGYYLTWLAWVAEREPARAARARSRAATVLSWLERHECDHDGFMTRIAGEPSVDGRNRAEFSFDLGMIVRGVAAAGRAWPALANPGLVERCIARIVGMSQPGLIGPYRIRPGAAPGDLPRRWSTVAGPHHVKVAAAIEMAASAAAENLVRSTADPWSCATKTIDVADAHGALYCVEGLLILGVHLSANHYLAEASAAFQRIASAARREGLLGIPPLPLSADARSDVMAQALRAGVVLQALGLLDDGEWSASLQAIADALADAVTSDRGLLFHPASATARPHENVWASLFAHQALTWWRTGGSELAAPGRSIDLHLV
jgi:hypothetical protein